MSERPIIFSAPMVRAILAGNKTQTRRVVKPSIVEAIEFMGGRCDGKPTASVDIGLHWANPIDDDEKHVGEQWCISCSEYPEEGMEPVGLGPCAVGDTLWVRETTREGVIGSESMTEYVADGWLPRIRWDYSRRTRPAIHMPRRLCRLLLRVTGVTVERLQEISENDAIAEGVERIGGHTSCEPWRNYGDGRPFSAPSASFRTLWESINAKRGFGWSVNPWVWAISFEPVEPPGA